MLPRFGYSNMMGLDMTMPIMGHSHGSAATPKPYLPQGNPFLPLSNMEMAALLDNCDARARVAEAQVAQLMQLMEMKQQNQGLLPTGLPAWPQGRPPTSEAQLPQRSLHQALGGASMSEREQLNPWDVEGSPVVSDEHERKRSGRMERMEQEQRRLAKKLRPKQTLRGYLEELRSENPRCIFIVRRINKLGFRSKSALESHYSKFGKVLQVCVAHSKVKPLPNSGQTARTRPGNFGLVVMQSPAAVKKVLDKGSTHIIDGVEVSVQKYQPSGLDDEVYEEEDEKSENPSTTGAFEHKTSMTSHSAHKEKEDAITSGSTQTGSSEGGGINSGNSDDWNRQESGSSSSSLGSELKARDHLSPALLSSQLAALAANTAAPWYGLGGLPAVPPEVPPEQSYMVSLSHSDLQELREMLRLKSARSEADLSEILSQLQHLLEDTSANMSAEKIMQAASLIQMAKHQLTLMHSDCRSRMTEISMNMSNMAASSSMPQMPFDASLGAPPGFGRGLFPGHSAQDR